jgi:hypothetical protein
MSLAPDHQRRRISVGERAPTTVGRICGSGFAAAAEVAVSFLPGAKRWFARHTPAARLQSVGFRLTPGGTHLARTLMLGELGQVLAAASDPTPGRSERTGRRSKYSAKADRLGSPSELAPFARTVWAWRATTDPTSDDRPVGARRRRAADAGDPCRVGARGPVTRQRRDRPGGAARRSDACIRIGRALRSPLSRPLHAQNAAFPVAKLGDRAAIRRCRDRRRRDTRRRPAPRSTHSALLGGHRHHG